MQFLLDNSLLIIVIVITVIALALPVINTRRYAPMVSPKRLTEIVNKENGVVIDVRKADDYRRTRIAASRNIPADQIQNRLGELDKSRPVVLVDRTGGLSKTVAQLLRGVGFEKVYILENGLFAWQKEGDAPRLILKYGEIVPI